MVKDFPAKNSKKARSAGNIEVMLDGLLGFQFAVLQSHAVTMRRLFEEKWVLTEPEIMESFKKYYLTDPTFTWVPLLALAGVPNTNNSIESLMRRISLLLLRGSKFTLQELLYRMEAWVKFLSEEAILNNSPSFPRHPLDVLNKEGTARAQNVTQHAFDRAAKIWKGVQMYLELVEKGRAWVFQSAPSAESDGKYYCFNQDFFDTLVAKQKMLLTVNKQRIVRCLDEFIVLYACGDFTGSQPLAPAPVSTPTTGSNPTPTPTPTPNTGSAPTPAPAPVGVGTGAPAYINLKYLAKELEVNPEDPLAFYQFALSAFWVVTDATCTCVRFKKLHVCKHWLGRKIQSGSISVPGLWNNTPIRKITYGKKRKRNKTKRFGVDK